MESPRAAEGRLARAEARLASAERWFLVGLVTFMVAMAFVQVLLRQLGMRTGWSLNILWGDTLLRHLVLWVAFLGACLAAARDQQFAMDASARLFHGKTKAAVQLLCHGFAAAVSAALARASWAFLRSEMGARTPLFSIGHREVQTWWFEVILPVGFALLAVHYSVKSAAAGAALCRREPTP